MPRDGIVTNNNPTIADLEKTSCNHFSKCQACTCISSSTFHICSLKHKPLLFAEQPRAMTSLYKFCACFYNKLAHYRSTFK